MTRTVNIHANCVRLSCAATAFGAPRDAGILLLGDSGAGKSDVTLRLIAMGAELVADDRTDLFILRGRLHARAPKAITGLMEVRGLGILELPHARSARVALAVTLVSKVARLPAHGNYAPPKALALPASARPPLVKIAAFEASAPEKIVAAAAAFARSLFRETVKA
jgi:hypothetical protein